MHMTDAAGRYLANGLASRKPEGNPCFRIVNSEAGSFKLVLDMAKPADEQHTVGEKVVLVLDEEVQPQCSNQTLDVETQPDGKQKLILLDRTS